MITILANSAIPILFPHLRLMVLALAPVVLIEWLVLRRSQGATLKQICLANAISTAWGVPLALLSTVVFGGVATGFDPNSWGIYFTGRVINPGADVWVLVMMLASVLLPCFILSVVIEGRYLVRVKPELNGKVPWMDLFHAHVYSYLALLMLDCVWLSRVII